MAKGSNMFSVFDNAVEQREREQASVTASMTGVLKQPAAPAAPVASGDVRGKITLSITEADRLKVKSYALQHGTTVSDLLHEWIEAL